MRSARFATLLVAFLLAAILLPVAACSPEEPGGQTSTGPEESGAKRSGSETTGGFAEPTVAPEGPEGTTPSEATLGPSPEEPEAVLRLEGDSGTRFSGTCAAGGEETVIRGEVPRRFAYDLNGQRLACRIQKRDAGAGSLKVILSAGGNTRSVQQTNTRGGTVEISYRSSQ